MTTRFQAENASGSSESWPHDTAAKFGEPAWILTYHEIEPENSNYLYALTAHQLDEQLRLISEKNRSGLTVAGVTFDDGHFSNFTVARPLLEQHGIRATFFVTAGRTEQSSKWMSWGQLRELVKSGHRVQSHGWSHKFLVQCSESELLEELRRSKSELEGRLGQLVDSISVPGGRWNVRVLRRAAETGYRSVYISDFWRKPAQEEGVRVLGRFMMQNTMTLPQLERWLAADVNSMRLLRAKGHLKDAARALVGDRLYHRLWCWLAVSGSEQTEEES